MPYSWSNEETFKFIELYQSESAIWDPKNELHKDKKKVNNAWNRIASSLEISVPDIKRKKETLMTAFRMYFKRKLDSIHSGIGEEIYKPVWMFYDAMEVFLKEKYEGTISTNVQSTQLSPKQKVIIEDGDEQHTEIKIEIDASSDIETNENNIKIPVQKRRASIPPDLKKAKMEMSPDLTTLNQVMLNKTQQNKTEDECELYGRLLANKLKRYSENERQEIMYEIDGLLLRRRRNYSPHYVTSHADIVRNNRPSSAATSYSSPSPSAFYPTNHQLLSSHHDCPLHTYVVQSPIQSPFVPPTQGFASEQSYKVFVSTNKLDSLTNHVPEKFDDDVNDNANKKFKFINE